MQDLKLLFLETKSWEKAQKTLIIIKIYNSPFTIYLIQKKFKPVIKKYSLFLNKIKTNQKVFTN